MQQEAIEGVIEDIIFHNPETGWTVLSLVPGGADASRFDDEVVVVGKMLELQPGETGRFTGSWTVHKNYGITAGLAHQIYDTYGENTIQEIEADPYRLAVDIEGVTFKTVDQIARTMGLANDAVQRVRAGILYALNTLTMDGHVYAPRPM